ncbi:LA_3696 family protein [Leptonema illini]|nr:hypothetical protein [Leptonema illini]
MEQRKGETASSKNLFLADPGLSFAEKKSRTIDRIATRNNMNPENLPAELRRLLGEQGTSKFVDYLGSVLLTLKEEVLAVSHSRSEHRLSEETALIRVEMAGMRADMAEMRTELKTEMAGLRSEFYEMRSELKADMANLRTELKTEMAELRADMETGIAELRADMESGIAELRADMVTGHSRLQADLKGGLSELRAEMKADFAVVHREISSLTRWILSAIVAFAVVYPAVTALIERFLIKP